MRLTVSRASLAVGAVLLGAALAHAEDLTLVSSMSLNNQPGKSTTTYMTSQKIKTGEAQGDTIVDVATGTMTFIDPAKKQYWTMTQADMAEAMKAVDQML